MPHVHVDSNLSALWVALALAFLNSIVKPLLTLLTIPITIFTFGFFLLIINALIIGIADTMVSGFAVDGFWWALLFSIVLSLCTGFLNSVLGLDQSGYQEEE